MRNSAQTYSARAEHCQNPLAKRLLHLLDKKQSNLALSADVTSAKELLHLADSLGPELCLLKTHIDIIEDFTPSLTRSLRELADKHQFLLFEDRKFADIGNTVKHQYGGGIYRIADWADIINAHTTPGPGIIDGLKEVGLPKGRALLLLAEMSSKGHLMTQEYMARSLQMAQQHIDFTIGFITQRAISPEPHWINMSPGIQLQTGGDHLGQQYVTPDKAIMEKGTDIIIVGRGIIAAPHPRQVAEEYRIKAWDAYTRRLQMGTISPSYSGV